MGKDALNIKSNGLRNELKAINQTLQLIAKELKKSNKHAKYYRIPDDARWVSDYSFCVDLEQGKDYHGTKAVSTDIQVD